MSVLEAILQGVIQGLTEFLPISSSGHLSLFQHFFGVSSENNLFFVLMLHLGTLIAVFVAFYKDIIAIIIELFKMIGDIFKGKFRYSECTEQRKMVIMIILTGIPLLLLFFVKDFFANLAEDNDIIVEGVCFMFTGLMLYIATRRSNGKKTAIDMKPKNALILGFLEGIAALPGVSRSGSTISGAMIQGFSKEFAVAFSFIMGIPAILAASVFEIPDAIKQGISISPAALIAGILMSAVVGLIAIRLVRWLVKINRYSIFAYYTFALGVVVVIIGIIEKF